MLIWLIRHGETDWNAQVRWQGHTDIPLNEAGRRQARIAANELRTRQFGAVLSSDLSRARETAEIIAKPHGAAVYATSRLREVNIGGAEGLTTPEVLEKFGEEAVRRWRTLDDLDCRLPGGESKREALHRALAAIEGFARWSSASEVAVVFHSLVMRVMIQSLFPALQGPLQITNCRYFILEYDQANHLWNPQGELLELVSKAEGTAAGA